MTLKQTTAQKLKAYSATAGAILALGYAGHAHVADAQGPIEYTDVDPDVTRTVTGGGSTNIRSYTVNFGGGFPELRFLANYFTFAPTYVAAIQPVASSPEFINTPGIRVAALSADYTIGNTLTASRTFNTQILCLSDVI